MSRTKEYYDQYWHEKKEYTSLKNPGAHRRRNILGKMLVTGFLPESARVLDLGCGEGETAHVLAELGHCVTGVDISTEVLSVAQKRCPEATFVQHDLVLPLPFDEESFDLVICLEVFEHLLTPQDLACEIHRMLVPDGTLICSVPYHGLLKNVIVALFAFERHYRITNPHIRFFTDQMLREMISSSGFQVKKIYHVNSRIPLWPTNSMALCRKSQAT